MRRFRGYETSEIGNMDETPVWFEMPGKSTLAESGEKEVRVATTGHEKERLLRLLLMLTEQNYPSSCSPTWCPSTTKK
jgi:hypothetical protein